MAREYEIARANAQCRACGKTMEPGQEFMAALHDEGAQFRRDDFCLGCWDAQGRSAEAFSVWRSRVPLPQQTKKPVVDDEVLVEFFNKLAGSEEPAKVNFRFVLALMLMRKRLLTYDGRTVEPPGPEVWKMHFRGPVPVEVVHSDLDEEKITEVAGQLGGLFEVSE